MHLLRDGTLAVFHDSDLKRMTGVTGVLEDCTAQDLAALRLAGTPETIPQLCEVLSLYEGTGLPLVVELKSYRGNHRALAERTAKELDKYQIPYCMESFDPRCLMWLRAFRPEIIRGQLSENFRKDARGWEHFVGFLLSNLLFNAFTAPDFIAYKFEDRRRFAPRICRAFYGAHMFYWTVRTYEDLKAEGYLTDAILNYVALLGWSPKGELAEQEIFSLDELVKAFDLTGISKSPAIFDKAKLDHFNAVYLRAMSPEDFAKLAAPYIRQTVKGNFDVAAIAALLQARCEKLTDIPEKVDFFDACPAYDAEFFTNKKSKTNPEVCKAMLEAAIPMLEALPQWTDEAIHDGLVSLAEQLGVKNATLMWPVRIAAAGKLVTPGGAVEICRILGRDETLKRLRAGLAMLENL